MRRTSRGTGTANGGATVCSMLPRFGLSAAGRARGANLTSVGLACPLPALGVLAVEGALSAGMARASGWRAIGPYVSPAKYFSGDNGIIEDLASTIADPMQIARKENESAILRNTLFAPDCVQGVDSFAGPIRRWGGRCCSGSRIQATVKSRTCARSSL